MAAITHGAEYNFDLETCIVGLCDLSLETHGLKCSHILGVQDIATLSYTLTDSSVQKLLHFLVVLQMLFDLHK